MPSSGTVTDPVVEVRFKTGHEAVVLLGRARIKSTATIEAGDLTLRTIKGAVVSPYDSQPLTQAGGPPVAYGSVTVAGSLMNSLRIRSFRGSIRQLNAPATGTAHIGTAVGGTMQVGFHIWGA